MEVPPISVLLVNDLIKTKYPLCGILNVQRIPLINLVNQERFTDLWNTRYYKTTVPF